MVNRRESSKRLGCICIYMVMNRKPHRRKTRKVSVEAGSYAIEMNRPMELRIKRMKSDSRLWLPRNLRT